MPHQRKPLPPNMDELKRRTKRLWKHGFNDKVIVCELQDFYDTNVYGLGLRKFRQLRRSWGLQSARSASLTDEELEVKIRDFKQDHPNAGARPILEHLLMDHEVKVPMTRIAKMLRLLEPEAVLQRKPKIIF
ncbi:hypothetical protein F5887DRAFT_1080945 [Amanita rubescens]|nr:hypothetical protein F5887DRAFT_1080945 [Amanita rubescens]